MRKTQARTAALGVIVVVAAAACGGSSSGGGKTTGGGGGSSAPGVTATTITIGSTQPLTGPVAPGYSEISKASDAYFKFINESGGINGRKIIYKVVDDAYDVNQTKPKTDQLLLQDHVFGIFNALGTPTHEKVVDELNSQKVPDLFVASGCLCWDQPQQHPETFGWQTDYTVEGKILGNYIKQKFAGKRIAYFFQSDDFGQDGVKGLDMEIPKSQVVARASYDVAASNFAGVIQTAVAKIAAAKPDLVVSFSVPAATAVEKLTMAGLHLNAQLAVSNVGSDPITLAGLLSAFSKGKAPGQQLVQGIITDGYLSTPADASNSWIQLFKKIHDKYIASLPFDGNVEYGMAVAYTFAEAVAKAGKNLTRDGIVKAIESGLDPGPGLVPFRFSSSSHAGYTGAQIGVISGTNIQLQGQPMTTDDGSGAITPYTKTQAQAPSNGVPSG